jgi:Ca2+-binding RTX toxin-like protein
MPTVHYKSFDGAELDLTPWTGGHVALLTDSAALDPAVVANLLAGIDAAWEVYRTITGRAPNNYLTYQGRLSIAEVPTTFGTNGGALGYLGATGIELSEAVWQELYGEMRDHAAYDQAVFYELGRNFWFYGNQLGAVDPFVTGFAIANRFISMEVAGLTGAQFHGVDFATFKSTIVDDLSTRFFSGASYTLAGTLGSGVAPSNPRGWGATDLAGSFLYQIYQNFGLADYARFFQLLAARPAAQSKADAFANFIAAASAATGFDFSYLDKAADTVLPIGSLGADALTADGSGRPLLGLGGDDQMTGSAAADKMLGGAGVDQLDGGEGDDVLIGGLGADVIAGAAGADRLEGGPGDDVIRGGEGDDQLFPDDGADHVEGGDGNDGLYFGAMLDPADAVDGGAGNDTVVVQGAYPSLAIANLVDVDVLNLLSGADTRFGDTAGNRYDYTLATADSVVAAGQILSVIAIGLLPGEDLHFDGSRESDGKFRIYAGRGVDDLHGGAGSDGFFFGADGNLTAADRVDGDGGIDSLALRGDHVGARAIVFADASFANIEVLALLSGHSNEYSGVIVPAGFDYDITVADGNVAAGATLDVNGARLGSDEQLRFDGRAESDGAFRILAGAGDDSLYGGAQADLIYGGLGADQIDGGGGGDTYLYRNAADSTAAARDTIAFSAGDRIDLQLIDANSLLDGNDGFAFIGADPFSAPGQLRAYQSGAMWIVEGDIDGDGAADLVIAVTGAQALGVGDFLF